MSMTPIATVSSGGQGRPSSKQLAAPGTYQLARLQSQATFLLLDRDAMRCHIGRACRVLRDVPEMHAQGRSSAAPVTAELGLTDGHTQRDMSCASRVRDISCSSMRSVSGGLLCSGGGARFGDEGASARWRALPAEVLKVFRPARRSE